MRNESWCIHRGYDITGRGRHRFAPSDVSDGMDGTAEMGTAVSSALDKPTFTLHVGLPSVTEVLRVVIAVGSG